MEGGITMRGENKILSNVGNVTCIGLLANKIVTNKSIQCI
jgi:hypothetical protein